MKCCAKAGDRGKIWILYGGRQGGGRFGVSLTKNFADIITNAVNVGETQSHSIIY